ncbi:hypothetical protein GEMRC1_001542 [Eukaryota sp. GEM-RC1]
MLLSMPKLNENSIFRHTTQSPSEIFQDLIENQHFRDFRWDDDQQRVQGLLSFIYNLLSSNTSFFQPCVRYLVSSVAQQLIPTSSLDLIKSALLKSYQLIPSSFNIFVNLLISHFPHRVSPVENILQYLQLLLFFIESVPYLRSSLWDAIITRFLEMDVEIKIEDIIDSDDEGDCSESEGDDVSDGDESSSDVAASDLARSTAEKLDLCMMEIFNFISNFHSKNKQRFLPDLMEYFFDSFDKLLLKTHKSKYTQFLIFYSIAISAKPDCKNDSVDAFVAFLLKRILSNECTSKFKPICTGYLASFIARGRFVTLPLVQFVLDILSKWSVRYVDIHGISSVDVDFSDHIIFYHVVIAILYICCFHLKDIVSVNGGIAFAKSLKLEYILLSKLNPLKMCLETVANEFARVAAEVSLLDCRSLIQSNRYLLLSNYEETVVGRSTLVDSFFPFDPYLLTESLSFIQPFYREWTGGEDSDDEDMESD